MTAIPKRWRSLSGLLGTCVYSCCIKLSKQSIAVQSNVINMETKIKHLKPEAGVCLGLFFIRVCGFHSIGVLKVQHWRSSYTLSYIKNIINILWSFSLEWNFRDINFTIISCIIISMSLALRYVMWKQERQRWLLVTPKVWNTQKQNEMIFCPNSTLFWTYSVVTCDAPPSSHVRAASTKFFAVL